MKIMYTQFCSSESRLNSTNKMVDIIITYVFNMFFFFCRSLTLAN